MGFHAGAQCTAPDIPDACGQSSLDEAVNPVNPTHRLCTHHRDGGD
jgi:hypothetical protein